MSYFDDLATKEVGSYAAYENVGRKNQYYTSYDIVDDNQYTVPDENGKSIHTSYNQCFNVKGHDTYSNYYEEVELDYSDFLDTKTDNPELYYYDEDTKVPFTDPDSEEENPEPLHYNDLNDIIQELEEVDLTYFFDGTLSEDYSEDDMLFYSDGYLPFTYEDENGVEQQNICVGTGFFAQFPDEETMNMSNMVGRQRGRYKPRPEPSINPRYGDVHPAKPKEDTSNKLGLKFGDDEEEKEFVDDEEK